jgi:hypothetical protein
VVVIDISVVLLILLWILAFIVVVGAASEVDRMYTYHVTYKDGTEDDIPDVIWATHYFIHKWHILTYTKERIKG